MHELLWDDLRIALSIRDAGSLVGAAHRLGVNTTTVLRRLRFLEKQLGTKIFYRSGRGYRPTDAGAILIQRAQHMREQTAEIERLLLGRDRELKGLIRVVTAFVVMHHLLPRPLLEFSRAYPGIEVEVVETVLLPDLRRGYSGIDEVHARAEAEVAIRMTSRIDERLVGRTAGNSYSRVYARRGAEGIPQELTSLDVLAGEAPWVAFERDSTRRVHDAWMHRTLASSNVRVRVDNFNAMAVMVSSGVGIGVLPTCTEELHPELIPVSPVIEELTMPVWILTHPDLRRTTRIRAFMEHVGDGIARHLRIAEERASSGSS